METKIIFGIIVFIAFCIWYAKQKQNSHIHPKNSRQISTEIDQAIDFGYKTCWIAVKTGDKEKIAALLQLKNIQPTKWDSLRKS